MAEDRRDEMQVLHPGWVPGRAPVDGQARRRPVWPWAAGAGAALALALGAGFSQEQSPATPAPPAAAAVDPPAPSPTPQAWHEDGRQTHAETAPTVPSRTVAAGASVPGCGIDDLSIVGGGWDAATGNTSMRVTATNVSGTACTLSGWPTVRVVQTAPLALTTAQSSSSRASGKPAPATPVLLPPGGGASAELWWRGYRNAADEATPQRLAMRFGSGDWRTIPLHAPGGAAAPFDLVDGGEIELGAWQPVSP